MALKVLLLRKKLTESLEELSTLERAVPGFDIREKDLENDIAEAKTDEERAVVEQAVESFEAERSKNIEAITRVRGEIANIEKEIKDTEQAASDARSKTPPQTERTENKPMEYSETRHKVLGLTNREIVEFMARAEIKDFVSRVKEFRSQQRSVTGAELGIPETALGILRDNVNRYSKLLKYISVKPLKGKAR